MTIFGVLLGGLTRLASQGGHLEFLTSVFSGPFTPSLPWSRHLKVPAIGPGLFPAFPSFSIAQAPLSRGSPASGGRPHRCPHPQPITHITLVNCQPRLRALLPCGPAALSACWSQLPASFRARPLPLHILPHTAIPRCGGSSCQLGRT